MSIHDLRTTCGVRFGLLGPLPARPSPLFLVLASSIEETLGNSYFLQGGNRLAQQGYLCASLDLPCHGQDCRADEPEGLRGWSYRLDHEENLFAEFTKRATSVLDHLVAAECIDPHRIAVCGTSRGGFAALHLMAADPRPKCAALMCPATELTAIEEFQSMQHSDRAAALSLKHLADKLAGRAVWIVIGDQDDRVGTDHVIAFARELSATARAKGVSSKVELHVLPEPRGHTTPAGAATHCAEWIARELGT